MPRKLKVYRTPIGFHDAYVAAPSQKAALAAWGAGANLFARGAAEEVDDPALTAEPLAHPGEVIRVARGTAAEHIAALPAAKRRQEAAEPPRKTTRRPRPDRDALDAADAALEAARRRHAAAMRDLADREAALARERRRLEREHEREASGLQRTRAEAERAWRRAVAEWQADD